MARCPVSRSCNINLSPVTITRPDRIEWTKDPKETDRQDLARERALSESPKSGQWHAGQCPAGCHRPLPSAGRAACVILAEPALSGIPPATPRTRQTETRQRHAIQNDGYRQIGAGSQQSADHHVGVDYKNEAHGAWHAPRPEPVSGLNLRPACSAPSPAAQDQALVRAI